MFCNSEYDVFELQYVQKDARAKHDRDMTRNRIKQDIVNRISMGRLHAVCFTHEKMFLKCYIFSYHFM